VLDDGEDVQPCSGQGPGFEEVGGEDRVCLAAEEGGPGLAVALGAGSILLRCRISQTVDGATLMPRAANSPWIRR
jgi:hypothetical protein